MYTVQENVRIVISLLKEYNIHHIVVNPGGTNIPIAQAVQDDPFFHCYSVPDERSAMYFAIGLHLQTGEVIATSCTSAQATRNYVPGLTEAFYKHTPIIAITTSKLSRYAYQEYMQAPDQTSLPRDAVKKSYDLPPVTDENTRALCCRLAKEAILEATHRNPGPVQINIRINDKQNSRFENSELPKIPIVKRYMAWDDWSEINLENKKILVVVGEHRPFTDNQKASLDDFARANNVVIYVNHLSNYHGEFSVSANLLLSVGALKIAEMQPDIVISIGGQTGDYPLYNSLNSSIGNAEHWRVSEDGKLIDTYGYLTKIFECPFEFFFNHINQEKSSSHSYFNVWKENSKLLNRDIELPFSNLFIAQQLSPYIPHNSYINFAILNSLRCWSYFDLNPSIRGFANVAAFGIDGCNSMLIGESMNTDELSFIITGDLAFFYDMNALGIRHIKDNVRILLVNNHGGAEFKFMTSSWQDKPNTNPYISANGHNGTARGWAENCGFKYLTASDKETFNKVKFQFIEKNNQPILFEVFTDQNDDVAAWLSFIKTNHVFSLSDSLKDMVKSVLGENTFNIIKKIARK